MASDYLLLVDGIKGESMDAKHPHAIEIHSFRWGATNSGSAGFGSGAGAGKVDFKDMEFTANVNTASADLALSCCNGKHITKAELFVRKQGGTQQDYYHVILENLIVSSFTSAGSDGSQSLPMDQFTLNFAKFRFEYKAQDAKGGVGATVRIGWDRLANRKL